MTTTLGLLQLLLQEEHDRHLLAFPIRDSLRAGSLCQFHSCVSAQTIPLEEDNLQIIDFLHEDDHLLASPFPASLQGFPFSESDSIKPFGGGVNSQLQQQAAAPVVSKRSPRVDSSGLLKSNSFYSPTEKSSSSKSRKTTNHGRKLGASGSMLNIEQKRHKENARQKRSMHTTRERKRELHRRI